MPDPARRPASWAHLRCRCGEQVVESVGLAGWSAAKLSAATGAVLWLRLGAISQHQRLFGTTIAICSPVCSPGTISEVFAGPESCANHLFALGEPGWYRTNDLLIKSQLLYH
jgi:hypothetical protein